MLFILNMQGFDSSARPHQTTRLGTGQLDDSIADTLGWIWVRLVREVKPAELAKREIIRSA